jgi:hypothetical protein
MDLQETIRQLKIEKQRIEDAIAQLEQLQGRGGADPIAAPKRRGRKSMPPQERREVAERMRRYWANRPKPPERTAPPGIPT